MKIRLWGKRQCPKASFYHLLKIALAMMFSEITNHPVSHNLVAGE
jgi:hypothetical protein